MKVHDLGTTAPHLWRIRFKAEFLTLGAIALDPRWLWPVFIGAGGRVEDFTEDRHAIVARTFDRFHDDGCAQCGKWAVAAAVFSGSPSSAAYIAGLFDVFPSSQANVRFQTARLVNIARQCRDAHRLLMQARQLVTAGIEEFGPRMGIEVAA